MPVHDWTRVNAGIFHHFHQRWIGSIADSLNDGRSPRGYYALSELQAAEMVPDVLALSLDSQNGDLGDGVSHADEELTGGTAIAVAAPKVPFTAELEMDHYALKQDTLVVFHSSGHRVIALVEIVSPGNKSSRHGIRSLIEKAASALYRGHHLLVLDLHPLGHRDPQRIHGEIWQEIGDDSFRLPPDKPLTLVSYAAGMRKRAYIEPIHVGSVLPDMPLFLRSDAYVNVPLEETYQIAWRSVPQWWRTVLESPPG